ncbi:hypothetical protein FV218_11035 [Methylobacterium sp. WL69]|uniref:hypothetical protein n=1 Tax=Methylobacterium sp. WL69 TaxID=2603893 RepID=UPI0011C97E5A|nr:hypothetical protein [Methylobacterium sp. WL69]TXM73741.1 hypothetical protein FV218_11035 [Methylobacterium sp. WL69]
MTDDTFDDRMSPYDVHRMDPPSEAGPAHPVEGHATRSRQAGMTEADLDAMLSDAVVGLMNVRRALDPISFEALVGAVAVEIEMGMDLARERALEATHRRRRDGNVVWLGRPGRDREGD